jgi:CcmD family protein
MKKLISLLLSLFFVSVAIAQENVTISDQQSGLRANDKIWVVMAVCVTILVGLVVYLVSIDRKITKLEKE